MPALTSWRFEIRCSDDGVGVDAATVDRRLGVLGELPERRDNRGLFGRGLRDVWLAQGAGRIEGVRDGRAVESWFFPSARDDPFAYIHVRDEPAPGASPGARVTVPLASERLPADGRLRTLVSQLVQLRPVLEDPTRELWLELPSGAVEVVRSQAPEPDPERPVLFDDEVAVTKAVRARVTVCRSARPLCRRDVARDTHRRAGRAVGPGGARVTFASHEGAPGTRSLYGEVRCVRARGSPARDALERPRPQVVVKVDRSGLNDNHPVVKALYAAIDGVLRPIVAAEERRARAHLVRAGRRAAGARPGRAAGAQRRAQGRVRRARQGRLPGRREGVRNRHRSQRDEPEDCRSADETASPPREPQAPAHRARAPLRFKQALVRLHPGERRGISLLVDPERIAPGTPIHVAADAGPRRRTCGPTRCPSPCAAAGRVSRPTCAAA